MQDLGSTTTLQRVLPHALVGNIKQYISYFDWPENLSFPNTSESSGQFDSNYIPSSQVSVESLSFLFDIRRFSKSPEKAFQMASTCPSERKWCSDVNHNSVSSNIISPLKTPRRWTDISFLNHAPSVFGSWTINWLSFFSPYPFFLSRTSWKKSQSHPFNNHEIYCLVYTRTPFIFQRPTLSKLTL